MTTRRERRRDLMMSGSASPPLAAGITAWLYESSTSGDQATWERVIGNHDAIGTAGRQPTAGADGVLTFNPAAPDVLAWEVSGATFSTDYLGIYFAVTPTDVTGNKTLFSNHIGPGGCSARSFEIKMAGSALRIDVFAAVNHGRRHTFNNFFTSGGLRVVGFEWNKDGSGDGRVVATRNGVVLVPSALADLSATPMTPSILVNVTGNSLIGNFRNDTTPSDAYGGMFKRNMLVRSGTKMASSTEGIFTQSVRDNLNAFLST